MARELDAGAKETTQVIAWLSHHLPNPDGKLIGGAEMTDQTLLTDAPTDYTIIKPENWQQALEFDKIVITGTDLLSNFAMTQLARRKPIVAVHHLQTRTEERAELLSSASTLICRTPRHLELELEWTTPKASTWVTAPLDITEISQKPKESFALWAARMHHQKGPVEAQAWADRQGLPLVMMTDKPRAEVLETMSRASHFVFLPNGFDAEPRAVIEAVLSGCQVHTNELAGITSVANWQDPQTLIELVSNSKQVFWDTVLA
jgi:hypothetical protein